MVPKICTKNRSLPGGRVREEGVIELNDGAPAETVSVAVPDMLPKVALIVVLPIATPVARPLVLIVANPVLDDVQFTLLVRSFVLESE